jgi:hypothetical protein
MEFKKTVPSFPLSYTLAAVILLQNYTGARNRIFTGHKKARCLQAGSSAAKYVTLYKGKEFF